MVVALSDTVQGESSLVGRVRKLLADFSEEAGLPRDTVVSARLCQGREQSSAAGDLEEIETRLRNLKVSFPDLEGVEVGPLVPQACAYFSPGHRRPGLPQGSWPPAGGSRGIAG